MEIIIFAIPKHYQQTDRQMNLRTETQKKDAISNIKTKMLKTT